MPCWFSSVAWPVSEYAWCLGNLGNIVFLALWASPAITKNNIRELCLPALCIPGGLHWKKGISGAHLGKIIEILTDILTSELALNLQNFAPRKFAVFCVFHTKRYYRIICMSTRDVPRTGVVESLHCT